MIENEKEKLVKKELELKQVAFTKDSSENDYKIIY